MLSEYDLELLTAFVDGEMTRRQRKAVLRLLHQSSEARAFLRDLQENAHLFKQVPHRKLEDSFADQVLGEIAARGLRPHAPTVAPARRWRRPAWLAAAAAAILVALGLWFSLRPEPDGGLSNLASLAPVERLLIVDVKDFAAERETLRKEIEREGRVHLDLAVRNQPEAVKRLVQVLQENKIDFIRNPEADAALKKKGDGKTQYLVYAEGLRPDELLAMLQQLGSVGAGKKETQPAFQTLTLSPLDQYRGQRPGGGNQGEPADDQAPMAPRFAVILTNTPAAGESLDPKVERFLATRRETSPHATQVLVTLSSVAV